VSDGAKLECGRRSVRAGLHRHPVFARNHRGAKRYNTAYHWWACGHGCTPCGRESMKTILRTETVEAAQTARAELNSRGIYACISGCDTRAYEVLVNDFSHEAAKAALRTANETNAASRISPERQEVRR
jgi:hypothetical protein